MYPLRYILFAAAAFTLVGCTTTGDTNGGLYPTPKSLKGEIKNNVYTAQDKSFSVVVPHKVGSYEYAYMQVKEQYSEYGAYVSFGPAAFDQSIYRIEIAERPPGSQSVMFEDVATKIVESYKMQLETSYGSYPQETESRQETINERKAHYWKLIQIVPAGKFISNAEATFTHEVYAIDFGKGAAIVWAQIPETTDQVAIEPRTFAESVVIY